jgi:hypothetical protein
VSEDPPFFSGLAPAEPTPAEALWILRRDDVLVEAQVQEDSELGWELQVLRNGTLFAARRFDLRDQAIAFGEGVRSDLLAEGWAEPG